MRAVVLAAGEGRRLRPLTERWPKPVLPIDGRPVVVTLAHELAAAGFDELTAVTGHLGEQIEELLAPLPYGIRFTRQPEPLGSADAVRHAGTEAPFLATAADTLYRPGDLRGFWEAFAASGAAGAIAIRRQSGRPDWTRIGVAGERVVRVQDPGDESGYTSAPAFALGSSIAARVARELPGPPYELKDAFQGAIDAGEVVLAVEIGQTRDLTDPLDLVEQNFPYVR